MSLALPQSVILQSFIVDQLYPTSLKSSLECMVNEGVLVDRDEFLKRSKRVVVQPQRKSWIGRVLTMGGLFKKNE